jgi:hypothetical protein
VSARYFSLEEATALLPRVRELVERLRTVRDEAVVKRARIEQLWQRLERGEAVLAALGDEQRALDALRDRLVSTAKEVEAIGCVLRDLDAGLVDFPCRTPSGTAYLCWRRGEPAILFWHGADEGFAGRKPIAQFPGAVPPRPADEL